MTVGIVTDSPAGTALVEETAGVAVPPTSESPAGTAARARLEPSVADDAGPPTRSDARAMSKLLFERLKALEEGTPERQYARNTLIELNLPLVRFVAARHGSRREEAQEIVQVGTIGLIKAIDRFDPAFGYEFPTFAVPTISGEIKRFFRDNTWAVHVPRRLQELRLELAEARDAFTAEHDREPTAADLAARLDLDVAQVIEGLAAAAGYTADSLDAPAADDGPLQAHAARASFVDPGFARVEDLHALKPLIAALPERERTILALRFGRELTQSQIAERLGISQMHVSRLLGRTLAGLRTGLLAD
ncbi:SigB/SigF/SigG family RNA polymerase sigma factor [Embleya scabrispora]|uniref:SigB/SigF/SigG family RNA polymerase sigma factor n=1 Tax=Embleya scabrispora TaxID=159449 RepID=UPI00035F7136|nr:SigB/SigF/SigG family RNA polymerase sigma factor [Embleya scabrispora]MYS83948.1 SigB/SigF/SigG family RNA polymerase sigma factor [Streptomyces sp. SID5474]